MWLVLALVHFWKAENTWKTSLKMCKLFSVVNSMLASLPPSFKTAYVTMLSETAKPICNRFMLLLDTCTIPSTLFHEVTCLQIWRRRSAGDQLKLWNNACLVSIAMEALSLHFYTHCHIFKSYCSEHSLPRIAAQPAGKVATIAQANQVSKWNNLSEIAHLGSALRGPKFTNKGKCRQCPFALWNSSVCFSLFGHVSSVFFFKVLYANCDALCHHYAVH